MNNVISYKCICGELFCAHYEKYPLREDEKGVFVLIPSEFFTAEHIPCAPEEAEIIGYSRHEPVSFICYTCGRIHVNEDEASMCEHDSKKEIAGFWKKIYFEAPKQQMTTDTLISKFLLKYMNE